MFQRGDGPSERGQRAAPPSGSPGQATALRLRRHLQNRHEGDLPSTVLQGHLPGGHQGDLHLVVHAELPTLIAPGDLLGGDQGDVHPNLHRVKDVLAGSLYDYHRPCHCRGHWIVNYLSQDSQTAKNSVI